MAHDYSITNGGSGGACTGGNKDMIRPGAADYNYGYNMSGGWCPARSGYSYQAYSSTPAGTHDVKLFGSTNAAGANFVDPTRNFLNWAIHNGSTGTVPQILADAFNKMSTMNDFTGPNTTYTIDKLISWVKAGFVPQNSSVNFTYPGDTNPVTNVGAMKYQAPAPATPAPVSPSRRGTN